MDQLLSFLSIMPLKYQKSVTLLAKKILVRIPDAICNGICNDNIFVAYVESMTIHIAVNHSKIQLRDIIICIGTVCMTSEGSRQSLVNSKKNNYIAFRNLSMSYFIPYLIYRFTRKSILDMQILIKYNYLSSARIFISAFPNRFSPLHNVILNLVSSSKLLPVPQIRSFFAQSARIVSPVLRRTF